MGNGTFYDSLEKLSGLALGHLCGITLEEIVGWQFIVLSVVILQHLSSFPRPAIQGQAPGLLGCSSLFKRSQAWPGSRPLAPDCKVGDFDLEF